MKYLVNTHWHYDHTIGNGAYADAFPALTVIAQRETQQMAGYNPGWLERYPKRTEELRRALVTGKDTDGAALTAERREELTRTVAGRDRVAPELRGLADRLPDLTFEDELRVDLGGREVQIKHLGRGNTAGDAVVYLPPEKILAAGDLLVHPVPYLGGGYPTEMLRTLKRLGELEVVTVVPGHGELLPADQARRHREQVAELIALVVAQVSTEVYHVGNGPRNLEPVRERVMKAIDVAAWRQKFAGDDKDSLELFDTFTMPGVVTAAYAEVWGR